MEQEFDVEIKEVLSRVQKVKAESLDDAINKASNTLCKLLIICTFVSYYVKISFIHFVISFTISYWRVLAPPLSWCAVL